MSDPAVAELLRSLSSVMNASGTRWYLFGAQAATLWGSPRLSADVDVTAGIDARQVAGFVATMREAGFDVIAGDPGFVEQNRVVVFKHRATDMPIEGTRIPVIPPRI